MYVMKIDDGYVTQLTIERSGVYAITSPRQERAIKFVDKGAPLPDDARYVRLKPRATDATDNQQ